MAISGHTWNVILIASAALSFTGCIHTTKEDDETRDAPVKSERPAYLEEKNSNLSESSANRYQEIFRKYEYLQKSLLLMGESNIDSQLNETIAELRKRPAIASEIFDLYTALTDASRENYYSFSEARWRTVYLLGELRLKGASAPLLKIAAEPLPSPDKAPDTIYATEYRIRARAVAGLENLKAVDELRKLYDRGGPLSGVIAASLYELGSAPKGINRLDPKEAFGNVDPSDFKPKRAVAEERKSELPSVPVTEESQSITPQSMDRK